MSNSVDFKSGDLVICEYAKGEKAKGRVVKVMGQKADVEVAITNRRSKLIEKDIIQVNLSQLEGFQF